MPAPDSLLPANITLLQPGSRYFRLVDALQALDIGSQLAAQVATLNNEVATLQSQVATLQSQVATLQGQIDALHVGAVVGAAPPGAAINRVDVVINAVSYSIALYAP
jgi:ribulose kinase